MTAKKSIVLLLLSGGKDSPEALRRLLEDGWEVKGLCIDGIQGKEKIGAQAAADKYKIDLEIAQISFFDENTWNPLKLLGRDIAMGVKAIKKAKAVGAIAVATGVKKSDIENPLLWWLYSFLLFGSLVFKIFGLRLIHPVWSWDGKPVNLD
jgi:tRNA(Ile)-lysidine synthase TilS/MesJ